MRSIPTGPDRYHNGFFAKGFSLLRILKAAEKPEAFPLSVLIFDIREKPRYLSVPLWSVNHDTAGRYHRTDPVPPFTKTRRSLYGFHPCGARGIDRHDISPPGK